MRTWWPWTRGTVQALNWNFNIALLFCRLLPFHQLIEFCLISDVIIEFPKITSIFYLDLIPNLCLPLEGFQRQIANRYIFTPLSVSVGWCHLVRFSNLLLFMLVGEPDFFFIRCHLVRVSLFILSSSSSPLSFSSLPKIRCGAHHYITVWCALSFGTNSLAHVYYQMLYRFSLSTLSPAAYLYYFSFKDILLDFYV